MTLDGFLAVLSIAIAVYALMSPVQKMKVRLSIHMQVVLAAISMALVLYLEMFDTVKLQCILPSGWCPDFIVDPPRTLSAPQLAFILVMVWMAMAYCIHLWARPWASALPAIDRIVKTLLADRKFDELLQFLTPHIRFLAAAAERRFVLQTVHDWFSKLLPDSFGIFAVRRAPGVPAKVDDPVVRKIKDFVALGRFIVPAEQRSEEIAKTVFERVVRSDETRAAIAKYRPDFAFKLLQIKFSERFEFANQFFRDLAADRGSLFYQEMSIGLPTSTTQGFALNPTHQMQNFLFSDCRVAEEIGVWKPVGDYIIELSGGVHGEEYVNTLNGEHSDHAANRDPVIMAIRFFDLMVSRAAFQDVPNHMWLMYLRLFIKEIEKVTVVPDARADDEFPTLGLYAIYEAFDVLGRWVHLVRYLPAKSVHLNFTPGQSGSIPMFAAETLGAALKLVLCSKRLPDQFKSYMYTCVMNDIKALQKVGEEGKARAMLVNRIANGGDRYRDAKYLPRLRAALGTIDHVLRSYVPDFEDAL